MQVRGSNTLSVAMLDNGNYQVADGDGEAQTMTETQLNARIANQGFEVVDGDVFIGGQRLGSSAALSAATGRMDNPVLPDVGDVGVDHASLNSQLRSFSGDLSESAVAWMAMAEMSKQSMRDISQASELRNAMQQMKLDAKDQEIDATEKKIEAERDAAWEQFAWACAGAVASAALGGLGASSSYAGTAAGGAMAGAAAGAGGVMTSLGTAISKTGGAQARADEAQIEILEHQRDQEALDQTIDSVRRSYEEAKEQMKQAMKVLNDMSDRQSQVVQTITR
ncbi:MAG: hypothetical protein VX210_01680 [Myxococcota bacterium]|nr:hypothetical protein [Myxococcota bacterium]